MFHILCLVFSWEEPFPGDDCEHQLSQCVVSSLIWWCSSVVFMQLCHLRLLEIARTFWSTRLLSTIAVRVIRSFGLLHFFCYKKGSCGQRYLYFVIGAYFQRVCDGSSFCYATPQCSFCYATPWYGCGHTGRGDCSRVCTNSVTGFSMAIIITPHYILWNSLGVGPWNVKTCKSIAALRYITWSSSV
jgi:hypothetical protein